MPKITIVCSAHRENGRCNAPELLRILEVLRPEVAFIEKQPSGVPPDWSLESKAIDTYRESAPIRRVVAEQAEAPLSLYPEIQAVFDCVEQTSEEYLSLREANYLRAHRYGFEYLDSSVCAEALARMAEIEDTIVPGTRDQRLIDALARWRLLNQSREQDMVRNIYAYSREHVFRAGVFLVGAAHKTGIVTAVRQYAGSDIGSIAWGFDRDVTPQPTIGGSLRC